MYFSVIQMVMIQNLSHVAFKAWRRNVNYLRHQNHITIIIWNTSSSPVTLIQSKLMLLPMGSQPRSILRVIQRCWKLGMMATGHGLLGPTGWLNGIQFPEKIHILWGWAHFYPLALPPIFPETLDPFPLGFPDLNLAVNDPWRSLFRFNPVCTWISIAFDSLLQENLQKSIFLGVVEGL